MIIIGHRGLAGEAPENTLLGLQKALDKKVDMVEVDVHVCASGELVVIHDATVDRTTNGTGRVSDRALSQLKQFDAGEGQQIPTLKEVVEYIDGRVPLNIELKGPGTAIPVARLINEYVVAGKRSYKDFLVSSFDHCAVKEFGELCPEVPTGAIIYGIPVQLAQCAIDCGARCLIASKDYINKALVDDVHRKGLKVYVYTVAAEDHFLSMQKLSIDGVIADCFD